MSEPDLLALIRRGINDPGSVLPRGDDYAEPIGAWGARAVHQLLADAGLLASPSTSDGPRTWTLPEEPGPEVAAVRDESGGLWRRRPDGRWGEGIVGLGWRTLVSSCDPLTDATAEVVQP